MTNRKIIKTGIEIEQKDTSLRRLKQLIWIYFILLVFEGALRKWVLPQFSNQLLLVRDPVALAIILLSLQRGLFKFNFYIAGTYVITIIAFWTTMTVSHGNVYIALFGARIFILHFPLIFIIGIVLNREDVIKIGTVILWLTIPMTIIMIVQFYSPQSDWVNRNVAGGEGGGFSGALGYFRPPGTFSFTSGLVQFYGLSAAFVFFFWIIEEKFVRTKILLVASGCLLISIPFSVSRTLLFAVATSFVFALIASMRLPKYFFRLIGMLIIGLILFAIVSNYDMFQTGLEVFTARFETANEVEGGLDTVFLDRFLGGMINAFISSGQVSFWGAGLGLGTNAGATLLTGYADFLISEGEWGRLIGEMGLLLGTLMIVIRSIIVIEMSLKSLNVMGKKNILPWMILSFGFLNILQGQWAQPTSLGFAVLSGGLILASLNNYQSLSSLSSQNSSDRKKSRKRFF